MAGVPTIDDVMSAAEDVDVVVVRASDSEDVTTASALIDVVTASDNDDVTASASVVVPVDVPMSATLPISPTAVSVDPNEALRDSVIVGVEAADKPESGSDDVQVVTSTASVDVATASDSKDVLT